MTIPSRLRATAPTTELLRRLRERHGALMIHQSGGCCDGSSPMCYPANEFIIGDRDVLLGVLDPDLAAGQLPTEPPATERGVPVWISGPQFDAWKHTQLIVDVVPGRGSGFSLEAPEGLRFLSRGRAFTESELVELESAPPVTGADWERGERPPLPAEAQVVVEAADACPVPRPK